MANAGVGRAYMGHRRLLRAPRSVCQDLLDFYLRTSELDRGVAMDRFMKEAVSEAKKGLLEGGIPIGSVLVRNGTIIGRGHNKRVQDRDPTAHAEIDCLRNAGRIGNYDSTILYSTLMPCYLCAGAVVQFGIRKVIVGESRNFTGAKSFMRAHRVEVVDLNLDDCYHMMKNFIGKNPELWNEDIGK
jgi:creatinine deaminase